MWNPLDMDSQAPMWSPPDDANPYLGGGGDGVGFGSLFEPEDMFSHDPLMMNIYAPSDVLATSVPQSPDLDVVKNALMQDQQLRISSKASLAPLQQPLFSMPTTGKIPTASRVSVKESSKPYSKKTSPKGKAPEAVKPVVSAAVQNLVSSAPVLALAAHSSLLAQQQQLVAAAAAAKRKGAGRPKFVGTPTAADIRNETKLEKNRRSAKEARRKKKEYVRSLEEKVQQFVASRDSMEARIQDLERRNAELMAELGRLRGMPTDTLLIGEAVSDTSSRLTDDPSFVGRAVESDSCEVPAPIVELTPL
eukprot:Opistho-1_new@105655